MRNVPWSKRTHYLVHSSLVFLDIRPFFFNYLVYGSADPIFKDLEKKVKKSF